MYQPTHFQQHDPQALRALMAEFPLATLVHGAAGLDADPVPLLWQASASGNGAGTLIGHVARANPLWQQAHAREVLAIFHGPQGYVSPSWYPSKAATHKVVPTWNYAWVQARGVLHAVDDAEALHGIVSRLTAHQEAPRSAPWAVSDAPPAYVQQMHKAIVGIRIELQSLQGKWKLSQNRSAEDHAGAVRGAAAETQPTAAELAAWMQRAR
jgi:transcriptional regulator